MLIRKRRVENAGLYAREMSSFTLVELLIVVAIIAILSSLGASAISGNHAAISNMG